MESRSENIFWMGINCMSLAVLLKEDSGCSRFRFGVRVVYGTALFTMIRRCSCRPGTHRNICNRVLLQKGNLSLEELKND